MRLSTSFILAAVMLTSTIHMVPVSAFPRSITAPSHHATPFSNHHSLVRTAELTLEEYGDYYRTLANLGGVSPWLINLALQLSVEIKKESPYRYGQMLEKWSGGDVPENHFSPPERFVLAAFGRIREIESTALDKGPIKFQSGGREITMSMDENGHPYFVKE
ncbi:hypothetical protein BC835DRAFT_1425306 [Cytidiella melzeri]|nr:hypothetical protein BC835DRAFT_1425306 [Cytidiella melzeri]